MPNRHHEIISKASRIVHHGTRYYVMRGFHCYEIYNEEFQHVSAVNVHDTAKTKLPPYEHGGYWFPPKFKGFHHYDEW